MKCGRDGLVFCDRSDRVRCRQKDCRICQRDTRQVVDQADSSRVSREQEHDQVLGAEEGVGGYRGGEISVLISHDQVRGGEIPAWD